MKFESKYYILHIWQKVQRLSLQASMHYTGLWPETWLYCLILTIDLHILCCKSSIQSFIPENIKQTIFYATYHLPLPYTENPKSNTEYLKILFVRAVDSWTVYLSSGLKIIKLNCFFSLPVWSDYYNNWKYMYSLRKKDYYQQHI